MEDIQARCCGSGGRGDLNQRKQSAGGRAAQGRGVVLLSSTRAGVFTELMCSLND